MQMEMEMEMESESESQPAGIDVDSEYDNYIESDDNDADRQSFYASTGGMSVASKITSYRYENGRRYHAYRDGTYYAPNDEAYSSYETTVHHLWLLTLHDQLFLAPLTSSPTHILDIGTGTGLWAIDMADFFPGAEITATDLSPIHPPSLPPNLRFEIDDANSPLTYPPDHFDMIHMRGLTGCVRNWPALYAQCRSALKPGGWLEHHEFSVETSARRDSPRYSEQMLTAFSESILSVGRQQTGMSFDVINEMHGMLCAPELGFAEVHTQTFIWPIGPWPRDPHLKDLGRWGERNWCDGIEGWVMALYTRLLGWTYEEVKAFVGDFQGVIKDRKGRLWQEVRVVWARKPFEGEGVNDGGGVNREGSGVEGTAVNKEGGGVNESVGSDEMEGGGVKESVVTNREGAGVEGGGVNKESIGGDEMEGVVVDEESVVVKEGAGVEGVRSDEMKGSR